MKVFILLLLLSVPVAAQSFIGGGATSSFSPQHNAGGAYVEAGTMLAAGNGKIGVSGAFFHEFAGNDGAKPGFRGNVHYHPDSNYTYFKPFVGGGISTLRINGKSNYWPLVTAGLGFKYAHVRASYLFGDGNRVHGWRYGGGAAYPIGNDFEIRLTADATKYPGLPTIYLVSTGVAKTF